MDIEKKKLFFSLRIHKFCVNEYKFKQFPVQNKTHPASKQTAQCISSVCIKRIVYFCRIIQNTENEALILQIIYK